MRKPLIIKGKTIGQGKPLICVPVMEPEADAVVAEVKALAERKVDMIEWRLDAFAKAESLNAIREVLDRLEPYLKETILVYTFRSQKQGGLLELSPEQIYDIHQVGAESGAVDFVDVEFFEAKHAAAEIRKLQSLGAHVITSHHDFGETPKGDVIAMLLEQMAESTTDVVKLAVMPNSVEDVLTLLGQTADFHKKYPSCPLITMSMGKLGAVSRVAGETFGSCVTFGAGKEASAPGQIEMGVLDTILEALRQEDEA